MSKIVDSPTLKLLLKFVSNENVKSHADKLHALKVYFLLFEPFLMAFWRNTTKDIPISEQDVKRVIRGYVDTAKVDLDEDFTIFLNNFMSFVPDTDNIDTEWQDVFTQDSMFVFEKFLIHLKMELQPIDELFYVATNTYGQFCEIIAKRYFEGDIAAEMMRLFEMTSSPIDMALYSKIREIEVKVYGL